MVLLIAVIFAINLARGDELAPVFLLGVALAVSAIPEGLPAASTVALAIAMNRCQLGSNSLSQRSSRLIKPGRKKFLTRLVMLVIEIILETGRVVGESFPITRASHHSYQGHESNGPGGLSFARATVVRIGPLIVPGFLAFGCSIANHGPNC